MKKISNKGFLIGVFLIMGLYLFLRLDGFMEKTTFSLDQGFQLLEVKEMVDEGKIRLIGPSVSWKTLEDRSFFIGANYYYVLAMLGIVFGWEVMPISISLLLIEAAFVVTLILWIKKKIGRTEALIALGAISVSDYLIVHSRFFWNPHFLLPLGVLGVISLERFWKEGQIRDLGFFGWWWGLAFSFHYSAVFWVIPLVAVLWNKRSFVTIWKIGLIPFAFLLGNLPYVVFELRHNFYNINTLLWVIKNSENSGSMEPHYFIYPLIVFGIVGACIMLKKIRSEELKIRVGITGILILVLIQEMFLKSELPLGHPRGWTYPVEKKAVEYILKDGCPKKYNIASTVGGDTRSYDLRYLLTVRDCQPMGVTEYNEVELLYLVAPDSRPPEKETVWEVNVLGDINVLEKMQLTEKIWIYKINRIDR
jgi:hypothetical protein